MKELTKIKEEYTAENLDKFAESGKFYLNKVSK